MTAIKLSVFRFRIRPIAKRGARRPFPSNGHGAVIGILWGLLILSAMAGLMACSSGSDTPPASPPAAQTRAWQMGFYYTPPRAGDTTEVLALALENIDRFSSRAEVAMIHDELPWDLLLDGTTDMTTILDAKQGLITYLQSKGLRIFFMADLTDGLSRGEEPPTLRTLGRSITEDAVQQRYLDYVLAFVERFQPDFIGLTAETNLVRQMASTEVYDAMVQAANDAADTLDTAGVTTPLSISVQVETAWGVLGGSGPYDGIEQDFADFPFIEVLGLSSYPYFGYDEPKDIPDNYYSRLLGARTLPAVVCEGGWPGTGVATITSTPQLQARYITRQADLLDSIQALAVIQTLFTDIDLTSMPSPYPANLPLFITLGLMELDGDTFEAKPALSVWDGLYARSLE